MATAAVKTSIFIIFDSTIVFSMLDMDSLRISLLQQSFMPEKDNYNNLFKYRIFAKCQALLFAFIFG